MEDALYSIADMFKNDKWEILIEDRNEFGRITIFRSPLPEFFISHYELKGHISFLQLEDESISISMPTTVLIVVSIIKTHLFWDSELCSISEGTLKAGQYYQEWLQKIEYCKEKEQNQKSLIEGEDVSVPF
jgi:hypothetical protein